MLDSRKCMEIYEYCQKQYDKLAKKGGYNPKHDKIVFEMAAKEFRMDAGLIGKAFDLASKAVSKGPNNVVKSILNKRILYLI